MAKIHPTAIVEDGAVLAENVEVGPMCFVGSNVTIGEGSRLIAQCHVTGYTTIGKNNVIYPFASIGCDAQDHALDLNTKRVECAGTGQPGGGGAGLYQYPAQ